MPAPHPIETPQGVQVVQDVENQRVSLEGPRTQLGAVAWETIWVALSYAFARVVDKAVLAPGVSQAEVLQLIRDKTAEAIAAVNANTNAGTDKATLATNARAAEIQQKLAEDYDALTRQIAGGSPVSFEVLIPHLVRIADVIISNEDRLEPILP